MFLGTARQEARHILERNQWDIETIAEANELLGKYDTDFDVIQATVGRGRKIGSYHIMDTNNPVMIFTAHI